jgi:hypothetical protein
LTPTGDRGKVETPQAHAEEALTSSPRKASACSGKEWPGFALNLYIEGISQEL